MSKRITKTPTIIDVIHNRQLFGSLPAFTTVETWTAWIVWLKAVFALPMDGRELAIYRQCTGRDDSPAVEPTEAYTVVGRRGGKSFISALTAVFVACFREYRQYLNAGEQAVVLVLARDRDQAKIVFRYIKGIIAAIPPLAAMVVNETADGVELENGVALMVKTSDFRAIRGLTIALCVADEVAFWDGQGVNPDKEIFTALRPAMATIRGSKLLCISTPYSKTGVMFDAYREHYGQQSDHALVWQADTRTMNPTLDQKLIERELEKDPESARAEWLGMFREDLEAAFSLESIEACVIPGRDELPPSRTLSYRAFCDPSGGRRDAYTLAIGHRESDRAVIDLLRAWSAPFDPELVTAEAAELCKKYGVVSVYGDAYAGEWSVAAFRKHGIDYQKAPKNRSEIYLDFIAPINARLVELPENRTLVDQLRRLERRRGRLGKDQIDHPANGHDDSANVAAGVSWLLLNDPKPAGINAFKLLIPGGETVNMYSRDKVYCGLTTRAPFAAVLARRHFTRAVIVGGAWQNERSIQAVLEDLKAQLKKEFREDWLKAGVVGLIEDSEAGRALADLAEDTIPLGWMNVYQPMERLRQDLETIIRVEGPVTAKLQIDEESPGARELAQVLDAKSEGGMYDALSITIHQLKEDEESFSDDIKVLGSYEPSRRDDE